MQPLRDPELARRWVHVGIGAGLLASFVYPVMVFVPLPRSVTPFVVASFGPALAFASVGLHRFLALHRDTVAAQAAAIANVVAGGLATTMLLVQTQLRYARLDAAPAPGDTEALDRLVAWIWEVDLGLDVSFDVFIGIGTALFGFAMLRHPALGRVMGGLGIAIGTVLVLGFNLYTMPRLPRDAGLFDPGPVTGLWYLATTILVIRGRRWMREQLVGAEAGAGR